MPLEIAKQLLSNFEHWKFKFAINPNVNPQNGVAYKKGLPVGIASASVGLLLLSNGILKHFLKKMTGRRGKHREIVLLAISKLYATEKTISKGLTDADITHQELCWLVMKKRIIAGWKKKLEQKTTVKELT